MTAIEAVFAGKQAACQQVGDTAAVNLPLSVSAQGLTSAAQRSVRPDDAVRSTSLSPQKPEQRRVRRRRKENCTRGEARAHKRTAGGRKQEWGGTSLRQLRQCRKTRVTNPSNLTRMSTCSCLFADRPHEQ